MAKNSVEAYGAEGKTNLLMFDPLRLTIVTDPNHALYDERIELPLDEAMVLNIMAVGVHTPITVTKDPESGETLVVAGRQRVRHMIEANARREAAGLTAWQIPATVNRERPADLAGIMVGENEIRRADSPMVRARKMAREAARGRDEQWLALMFGVSVVTVRESLGVLEQPAAVRNAVEAGKIGMTAARKLAKFTPEEQRTKVAEMVKAGEGRTGHEKARAVRAAAGDDQPKLRTRKELQQAHAVAITTDVRAVLEWAMGTRKDWPL